MNRILEEQTAMAQATSNGSRCKFLQLRHRACVNAGAAAAATAGGNGAVGGLRFDRSPVKKPLLGPSSRGGHQHQHDTNIAGGAPHPKRRLILTSSEKDQQKLVVAQHHAQPHSSATGELPTPSASIDITSSTRWLPQHATTTTTTVSNSTTNAFPPSSSLSTVMRVNNNAKQPLLNSNINNKSSRHHQGGQLMDQHDLPFPDVAREKKEIKALKKKDEEEKERQHQQYPYQRVRGDRGLAAAAPPQNHHHHHHHQDQMGALRRSAHHDPTTFSSSRPPSTSASTVRDSLARRSHEDQPLPQSSHQHRHHGLHQEQVDPYQHNNTYSQPQPHTNEAGAPPASSRSNSRQPPALDVDSMPLPSFGHREPDFNRATEMVVETEHGGQAVVSGNAPSPTATEPLAPCEICGRNFALSRLEKHKAACAKASKQRKAFDVKESRLKDFGATEKQSAQEAGRRLEEKLKKKPKSTWRQQRAQFLANVAPEVAAADGIDTLVTDERVECAGCGRKFAKETCARHEPKCLEKARRR